MSAKNIFYLRIEAANFSRTMFDTDSLSCIRGSSWACLEAPRHFAAALQALEDISEVTDIAVGGSIGTYSVTTRVPVSVAELEEIAEACMRGGSGGETNKQADPAAFYWQDNQPELFAILPHLTFLVVAEPVGDAADVKMVSRQLKRRLGRKQYNTLSIDLPPVMINSDRLQQLKDDNGQEMTAGKLSPEFPCALDKTRPKATFVYQTHAPAGGGKPRAVRDRPASLASAAKFIFGRTARRNEFYSTFAGFDDETFGFADNFDEIALYEQRNVVPEKINGRMAVLYMDINGLGGIREKYLTVEPGERAKRSAEFSGYMASHRKAFLGHIVRELSKQDLAVFTGPSKTHYPEGDMRPDKIIRLETLIWGGDEACLVFPACALFPLLEILSRFLNDPTMNPEIADVGAAPTYGIGIVIGRHKSPIGQMKKRAENLADQSKELGKAGEPHAYKSFVDVEVLPGQEVPFERVEDVRNRRFTITDKDFFSFDLADVNQLHSVFADFKGVSGDETRGIPRQKLRSLVSGTVGTGTQSEDEQQSLDERIKSGLCEMTKAGKYLDREGNPIDEKYIKGIPGNKVACVLSAVRLWDYVSLAKKS